MGTVLKLPTTTRMLLSVFFITLCALAARADDSESKEASSDEQEDEPSRQFFEALMNCSIQYDIPPNYFQLHKAGDAPQYANEQCFIKCGMVGFHYLNEEGIFNEQLVRTIVNEYFTEPSTREQAINAWIECDEQCHSEAYADDSCERAYDMFQCYNLKMNPVNQDQQEDTE